MFMEDREASVAREKRQKREKGQAIAHLEAHVEPFVTVGELAEYWLVSRKQIYKQIEAGTLPAIRLGPRLLRIRTADAIDFEQRAKIAPADGLDRSGRLEDLRMRPLQMSAGQRKRNRS
jgi:excisionase family DNA binding protein